MSQTLSSLSTDAFAALADAVFVVTPGGMVASANAAAGRLLGRAPAELVGVAFTALCREPELATRTMTRQALAHGGEMRREELDLVDAAGRAVPVSLVASAVLDDAGDLSSILVVARDIAAEQRCRSALEAEVSRARDMALRAERLATLGTMAASVGHELNNTATLLSCGLEMLRDEGGVADAETMQLLDTALAHVTHFGKNLLRLARPVESRTEPVDVGELATQVVGLLHLAGRTKRVSVQCDLEPTGLEIMARRTQLEQVLINLVANAADALQEAPPGERTITVRVRASTGGVELRVDDNGPGMAPELLARVFEPFVTTKEADRGTGLGLPVVKRIVEEHGGRITLESEPGAGTRATVFLPAQADAEVHAALG